MTSGNPSRRPFLWEASYPSRIGWDDPVPVCGIGEYLAQAVRRYPQRTALQFLDAEIGYDELGRLVLQAAASFRGLGGLLEDGLALLLPNTPWHSICFFGAASAGVRVVQASPMDSSRELAHKLRDSSARTVVTLAVPDLLQRCGELQEAGLIDRLIVASDRPWGQCGEAPLPVGVMAMEELVACDPLPGPIPVDPAAIAVLQYTGGTTGLPKGAALSHANVTAAAEISAHWQTVRDVPEGRGERVLMYLPLFHSFALTMVNRHLGHGNTVHLRQRFDPATVLEEIERLRIDVFHGVPTMFIGMLADAGLEAHDISCLRYATSGGAPLPAEIGRAFEARTGVRIHPGWGMSEAAAIGCQHVPGGEIRPGSIGLPLPGIELRILRSSRPRPPAAAGRDRRDSHARAQPVSRLLAS
ncbi:long-chain acyl-CoA synthetase [Aquamicrobium terrae]